MKKILAILLSTAMLACLSACGDEETSSKEKEIATETVAVDEEKETEEETETETEAEVDADADADVDSDSSSNLAADIAQNAVENYDPEKPEETVVYILKEALGASFGDNVTVEYDEADTNYTISVWQDGFAAAVKTDAGADAISSMTGSLTTAMSTLVTQARTIDEDANITFNFVSDTDQSEILLTIYNDTLTYSIAE